MASLNAAAPGTDRTRFVFIDALRGVASFGVFFYHLFHNGALDQPLRRIVPSFLVDLTGYGTFGVPIFFVLSGFVIAHSLRDIVLSRKSFGQFILRRQLRLDPPYWVVIALALALQAVEKVAMPATATPFPSIATILLNLFYLQGIFNAESILTVAWTLCLEVQFYLVFILLLLLGRRFARSGDLSDGRRIGDILVFVIGCLSLVKMHFIEHQVWFIHTWFLFAAGVLCYRAVQREISARVFFAYMAAFALSMFSTVYTVGFSSFMVAGFFTCLLIYAVGKQGALCSLWNGPVLQYLGRVSYSLYLVHWLVIIAVYRIGSKLKGQDGIWLLAYLLLAAICCLLAGHILHMLVEKPSMRLASRIKYDRIPAPNAPAPVEETPSGFATEDEEVDNPESARII